MNNRFFALPSLFLALFILGAGCTVPTWVPFFGSKASTTSTTVGAIKTKPDAIPTGKTTTTTVGTASPTSVYEPFDQTKYKTALTSHQPIYLYFFASWCSTCQEQDSRNTLALQTLNGRVHGFQVRYNDGTESAEEKKLAEDFHVEAQSTGIFLSSEGKEVKRMIGTESAEQLRTSLE